MRRLETIADGVHIVHGQGLFVAHVLLHVALEHEQQVGADAADGTQDGILCAGPDRQHGNDRRHTNYNT